VHAVESFGGFELDVKAELCLSGFTVLWGASGSGKTTFLRAIAGFSRSKSHRVVFGGQVWESENYSLETHKRNLSYIFQDGSLLPHLNVSQNLQIAREFASEPLEDYESLIDDFSIRALLEKHPKQLSGGEKQRVTLARSIMANPEVIFMDEPLSSLDLKARMHMISNLQKVRSYRIPVVYVTHSVEELIALADEVLVLGDGKLQFQGPLFEALDFLNLGSERLIEPVSALEMEVGDYDHEYNIQALNKNGLQLQLPRKAPLEFGRRVRAGIYGSDVVVFTVNPDKTSALNVLEGHVSKISVIEKGKTLILVQTKIGYIRTLVTSKSLDCLNLTENQSVWIAIKAVNVAV
jgi:molybdate transport system ATP-binding protein